MNTAYATKSIMDEIKKDEFLIEKVTYDQAEEERLNPRNTEKKLTDALNVFQRLRENLE